MKLSSKRKLEKEFALFDTDLAVYRVILEETIFKRKRCAQITLQEITDRTGIPKSTVNYSMGNLVKDKLIEIDKTEKTNIICLMTTYKCRWDK